MSQPDLSTVKNVALIGNHLPRHCGIATFTSDVASALAAVPDNNCFVVAMNDTPEGYRYPDRVRFTVQQNRVSDYRLAADFLNMNQVDVVCVQHEYGIFGGNTGSHILEMLETVRVPIVTTLHTVLREPNNEQREVMMQLGALSDRLVVMSHKAFDMLGDIYGIERHKIVHIPHGIPDLPFVDPNYYKDQFDVEGRTVLLTFGLLSPGKGLEYMIGALPEIVARHPEVVYIILGATHPHVKRDHGEEYRMRLGALARELGVEKNVVFHNRFVDLKELCEFLGAADIYVTPYLGVTQITSGTLAYALGAGKAVVSTPYWYAEEMLDEGRGRLVPFKDAAALAREVNYLLDNPVERHAMRKRAYTFCRDMVWEQVGLQYMRVFAEAKAERSRKPRPLTDHASVGLVVGLPDLNLEHLLNMTDDTGLLQHARMAVPNREHGYCTDDNARALMVALKARDHLGESREINRAIITYLSFLDHAFDENTGRFKNFMSYDRKWLEEIGSDDSHGRALWALGEAVAGARKEWMLWLVTRLFKQAMGAMETMRSPRTIAFGMCGLAGYLSRFGGDRDASTLYDTLANALHLRFLMHATADWPWLEDRVTYDNGRIAGALIEAGAILEREDMTETGLRALDWLLRLQTAPEGHFVPIGNRGWYERNGPKARFDQQPLEAAAMIDACLAAFRITGEDRWVEAARKCFDWFMGRNDLRTPLVDYSTGGCRDGLSAESGNQNQGAESTLSWLMALLSMQSIAANRLVRDRHERERGNAVSAPTAVAI